MYFSAPPWIHDSIVSNFIDAIVPFIFYTYHAVGRDRKNFAFQTDYKYSTSLGIELLY